MSADPTRARDVFLAAADIPDPAARAAFLDKACGDDDALRGRVEALLRAHDDPDSLLDAPVVAPFPPAPAAGAVTRTGTLTDEPTRTHGDGAADEDLADALSFLAPPGRPDSLGRLGHYEVLEVLGRGGFGIVYRAFDEVLQRVVAVKILSPSMAATSPARKRFLREARSSAAVRHENVVQVHAVEEQPLPYLVMEFVPGETLQQRLDRTGPLDLPDILRIGRQVAEGLAAAHEKGLIHRDIKPANILIGGDPQEHVKITDFGLARAADDASLTRSGTVAGTPMYMAPEQAKGESLDHRADLFSLGSVLYVMCTGRPPFRAENTLAVLKRVAEDTPRPIREIIPEVPEWLCRVVGKLHAKDPAGRFQSAKEVAEVLADCEAQVKAHGALRDYSRIPGGPPAKPRGQWVAAAVCLSVALLAALAVTELTNLTHFFHTPHYWINLGVDDPNVTISIFHARTGDPERDFADRPPEEPLPMMQFKGQRRIRLPAGDYWFAAVRDGRLLYTERVAIDRSRVVLIPWAAEVAKREKPVTGSEPGWVQLFNGKELTGWKTHPTAPGKWQVKDGVLVGSGGDGYLFSKRDDYENFHLRAEVKINAGGDSGVFFRSRLGPLVEGKRFKGHSPPGYEAQVCVDASAHRTGSLFLVQEGIEPALTREDRPLVLPDQWCTLEVIAEDPWLTVKVNGERTANVKNEVYSRGHLALQMWNEQTVVQFRKIEIKELPGGGSPAPANDYALAFDGKDSRVEIPSLGTDGTHPLTVEFYCRPRAFSPKGDCILAMSGKGALFVSIGGDPPFLTSGAFLGGRASGQHFLLPDKTPERFHVAAVWDGREYRLFVDGRRVGRTYATGIRANAARGTALGIDPSDPSKGRFDGVLDEVRLSKTARYDADFIPAKRFEPDKDTLALYHCDEGRGERLTDSSGNGHHGTIVGAKWVKADGSPVADQEQWVRLFNGKDLTGWKTHPDRPGAWKVEGGVLVGRGPAVSHLLTERGDYRDFHLRARVRLGADSDSGIVFRCGGPNGATPFGAPHGYEANITPTGTGDVYDTAEMSSKRLAVTRPSGFKPGTWATLELVVRGNRIAVLIDGKPAAEYTDPRSRYSRGHLALQIGGSNAPRTVVEFREVEVKELPADEPGWVPLFNGKYLTGWKTHPDRPGGWAVEDGALVGKSGPGRHYLFTQRDDYADFVLRAECRISAGGEGGLFFRCEHGFGRSRWGGQWTEPQGYELGINQGSRDFQTGSLYGPDDKPPALRWVMDEVTPADQWFPIEVEARGNRITVCVRGRKLYEYTDARRLYQRGHIALEAGAAGTTIRFRNVQIRELPPSPAAPGIDLMPLAQFGLSGANVKRDASGIVVTPPNGKKGTVFVSSIPIATALPREFVLEASVERLAGADGVTFNVPAFGTDFMFAADVFPRRGHYTGLSYIDGKDVSENGSGVRGRQLTNGNVHQVRITVRSSGVVAEIDGGVVAEHRGYEKLASKRRGPGGARFFMQVVDSPYRIHALRLVPLSDVPAAPDSDGWVPLFNGKDLTGWTPYRLESDGKTVTVTKEEPSIWKAENGELRAAPGSGQLRVPAYLVSNRRFNDFELKFQLRVTGGKAKESGRCSLFVRSPVWLWSRPTAQPPLPLGPAVKYWHFDPPDPKRPSVTFCKTWTGTFDQGLVEMDELNRVVKRGELNDYHVKCVGKRMTVRVNGLTIVDGIVCGEDEREGLLVFGLDPGWEPEVTLRDIRIKELASRPKSVEGWGKVIDPKEDCTFQARDGKVRIGVPGTLHNLNPTPQINDLSAPRLLQDAEGDFSIQVKVLPFQRPPPNASVLPARPSYVGAGLLVWVNEGTFIRLLRADDGIASNLFAGLEAYQDGKQILFENAALPLGAPGYLRIERREGKLQCSSSADGENWQPHKKPLDMQLPAKVRVGVVAVNSTTARFEPEFAGLRLTPAGLAFRPLGESKGLTLGGLGVAIPVRELLPLPKLAADGPP